MKTLISLLFLALSIPLSAQDVYKGRKFFGGYFYINSDALKDILIDGDNTDSFGKEYWKIALLFSLLFFSLEILFIKLIKL